MELSELSAADRTIYLRHAKSRIGPQRTQNTAIHLRAIRDENLFREHGTFERYCLLEHGILPNQIESYLNPTVVATFTAKPKPPPETSGVYFVRCEVGGAIKIGFAKDPVKRMAGLQIGCPHRLELVAVILGATVKDEQSFHARFEHIRGIGEWFSPAQDLLDFITEVSQ